MPTLAAARDDIMGAVQTQWDAGSTAGELLLYEDRAGARPSANVAGAVQLWGFVQVRHISSERVTLAGTAGSRRFRRDGLLTLQLFIPQGDGLVLMDAIGQEFLNALEGKTTTNGVSLRNVRVVEVGEDGPWFQANVLANYDYDEVK